MACLANFLMLLGAMSHCYPVFQNGSQFEGDDLPLQAFFNATKILWSLTVELDTMDNIEDNSIFDELDEAFGLDWQCSQTGRPDINIEFPILPIFLGGVNLVLVIFVLFSMCC